MRVLTPVYPRQNVGRQGADIVVGQKVIGRGEVLNLQSHWRAGGAGSGCRSLREAHRRDSLDGNEIADPGEELKPGQIYDINKFTLSTIIAEHGGVPMPFATAQDTIEALEHMPLTPWPRDVLVFSGGSSLASAI